MKRERGGSESEEETWQLRVEGRLDDSRVQEGATGQGVSAGGLHMCRHHLGAPRKSRMYGLWTSDLQNHSTAHLYHSKPPGMW